MPNEVEMDEARREYEDGLEHAERIGLVSVNEDKWLQEVADVYEIPAKDLEAWTLPEDTPRQ